MLADESPCDLLLTGGRVIDPETGTDGLRAVGIRGGTIVHIGEPDVATRQSLDVSGLIVAPGFVDLHSHAQSINGLRMQALDGVTTALELEAGALPVGAHYEWAEAEGRPVNFGFSAGWAYARMHVLDGVPIVRPQDDSDFRIGEAMFTRHQALPGWRREATRQEVDQILGILRTELEQGALGIGVLLGYAPESGQQEFSRTVALAAELDQPVFVHARYLSPGRPGSSLEAVEEIIRVAAEHDAHVHLCHMNSTSGQLAEAVAEALTVAREDGVRVTTESYPYGTGSTAIGAEFLAPEQLAHNGLEPRSITYLVTGERVADAARLREIRAADPGGPCLVDILDVDHEQQRDLLLRTLTFPGGAFASDAGIPNYWGEEAGRAEAEAAIFGDVWPLPDGLISHPRSSGCYSRVLSWLVRETGTISMMDAIRRSSLVPAQLLETIAPAMARKGRVQVGADADLAVFNPATVGPRGGFTEFRPSHGFAHVLVGGARVVADGQLQTGSLDAGAVRALSG